MILMLVGVVSLLALAAATAVVPNRVSIAMARSRVNTAMARSRVNIAVVPSRGEHGDGSESGDEESGTQFALDETFDEVRAGARLVLSYDSKANVFVGRVENTTGATLSGVRVEVHLSNGTELGPTAPVDLTPGQIVEVALPATSQTFTSWSAHPEVG